MILNGGDEGDRTPDLGIANAALSHLSYIPTGFDPYSYNNAPIRSNYKYCLFHTDLVLMHFSVGQFVS